MKNMFTRFVMIFFATVLAVMVLMLTMLYDPQDSDRAVRSNVDIDQGTDWGTLTDQAGDKHLEGQTTTGWVFEHENEKGQIFKAFGDEVKRLPRGVLEIVAPKARLYLKPNQVIEIRADQGTIVAPDNRPRTGHFTGNVVITLFSSPKHRPVNLHADSPDVTLRLLLEDVEFDMELGRIDSNGSIHLAAGDYDFYGRGLSLVYDEANKRIERLRIARGQKLVLTGRRDESSHSAAQATDPARQQPTAVAPKQFYRAEFTKNIRIRTDELHITDCDQVQVIFAVVRQQDDASMLTQLDANQAARSEAMPQPDAEAPIPTTIITMDGPVLIESIDAPADLTDADDLKVTLSGQPLRINGVADDVVVTVPHVVYNVNSGQLELSGNDVHGLIIDADQAGVLSSRGMRLDIEQATATFSGPGQWHAHGDGTLIARFEPERQDIGTFGQLPPGTRIKWRQELELALYLDPDRKGRQLDRILAIKRATFRGGLELQHTALHLTSDSLTVGLTAPAEPGHTSASDDAASMRQHITDISASGNVHVTPGRAPGVTPGVKGFDLRGDRLDVTFEKDGDSVRATQLAVDGNVKIEQDGSTLRSGSLLATLARDGETPLRFRRPSATGFAPEPKVGPPDRRLALRRIQADDKVHIEIVKDDARFDIYAHQLIAEGTQIDLLGQAGEPVRLITEDGMISAPQFVIVQAQDVLTVRADGAGTASIFGSDAIAGHPDRKPGDRQQEILMTATWHEAMLYDDRRQRVQFLGQVVCDARKDRRTSRLEAERLTIQMLKLNTQDDAKQTLIEQLANALEPDAPALSSAPLEADLLSMPRTAGDLIIRTITAEENVRFETTDWRELDDELPLTRLTIEGPKLTFDSVKEALRVHGRGRMGLEDYRPETRTEVKKDRPGPLVRFSGRGVTIFTWAGHLHLDARSNDMRIEEQVQMLHQPQGADDSEIIQLDCRHFLADLIATGGLARMMGPDAAKPRLQAASARGDVSILGRGREIFADELDYTDFNNEKIIVLRAAPRREVRVIDLTTGATSRAKRIRWFLQTDRFEVENLGGVLPVPK